MSFLNAQPTAGSQTLRALARYPDRTAFVTETGNISYAHVIDMLGRMQAVLAGLGLPRGAGVAALTSNRWETWCLTQAAQASALCTTPLHPLGSLEDHLDQLADAEIQVLVVDAETYAARGADLAQKAGGVRHVLTIGKADYGIDLMAAAAAIGSTTPRDLARPDDSCVIGYTGGTTGKSKGVWRDHRSAAAISPAILADFELPDTPHYLAVAPISHVAGTKVMPTLMRGGSVTLMKSFDPERVLQTIERQRINFTLLVPTMIYVLLDHPALAKTDLSSLELLLYGASPMSPTRLVEGLERIGPVFSQLYGQSECYPVSVLRKADHDPARPELFASCGFPLSNCDVALLNEDGEPVAPGEAGEICVRAPQVMGRYWKRPEQTEEVFRHGWLHTGDVARADERGYLYIVDRMKDMIVTGGFNVYPREVEDALTSHPAVAMAAVIGVPDAKWGEAVKALVVRKAGGDVTDEELIALVKQKKGSTQAPKSVEFIDELPVTPVGKVDKKVLRARYWAGQQRMVG
ncbi:acyl-CoA synthetase [Camelimonas fluminis]|uniref:AMP-binding protein n=1 Tax=Camelimonas fluminis TaxID=1576911 RepID=A0ABV7UDB2_9HYPH|nr:AMP-binding protein [Camelimonas fluminis]GHE46254.1 acyl-CoA synthetase [Camelimonas fluminis]